MPHQVQSKAQIYLKLEDLQNLLHPGEAVVLALDHAVDPGVGPVDSAALCAAHSAVLVYLGNICTLSLSP